MDKTDAIVLKIAPYSETTLLTTLLTREHGVVRALAKGVRRAKGGSVQAAFEPFAWIHASVRQKSADGLGTVFGAELREGWPYLRRDVDRLAYAALGLEVLGGVATQSPSDPNFFDDALLFLEVLEKTPGPGSLVIALLLRLLHDAGFPPHLAQPDWTAQTLPPSLMYHFDRSLIDAPHAGDSPHSMRLARSTVAPLLGALATPPQLDGSLKLPPQSGLNALRWLIRVWEDHLGGRLNAARFLEKMVLRPAR